MLSTITVVMMMASMSSAHPAGTASQSGGTLLVANKGEHTMGLIDARAGRQVAIVQESGITGHEVIASPDGRRAFVPIYGDSGVGAPGTNGSTLDVIDLASRKLIQTVDFGHGVRPHCPLFGPKDGMLYVTTELDQAVAIIDPQSLKIVGQIPTGAAESHMLAITRDGTRGYTANVGPGTVSALDMVGRKTIAVIPVAEHVQRISVTNDGRWVFTSDTQKPRLAVIDTGTNKVDRWIGLQSEGYGSAPTPDGKWLLIAMPSAPGLAVIDLSTMQVAHNVSLPPAPQEVIVQPDGQAAYVSCDRSHEVAVISTSDWKVEKLIDAGKSADGLAWAPAH
jgi:DNA-binding beta-propeller fold protein YncE